MILQDETFIVWTPKGLKLHDPMRNLEFRLLLKSWACAEVERNIISGSGPVQHPSPQPWDCESCAGVVWRAV